MFHKRCFLPYSCPIVGHEVVLGEGGGRRRGGRYEGYCMDARRGLSPKCKVRGQLRGCREHAIMGEKIQTMRQEQGDGGDGVVAREEVDVGDGVMRHLWQEIEHEHEICGCSTKDMGVLLGETIGRLYGRKHP